MSFRLVTLAATALALTGCATVPADAEDLPVRTPEDSCRAEPGQRFVGERATAESGAAIMAATRSTRLRWVPPRTAITMEYALGRVTVSYDDNYRITQVTCS